MADRVKVEDIEWTVLEATRDASKQLDDTGLYAALSVAARARENIQLDPEEWQQLDRPAYRSLLAQPKRWRAQPLQLDVAVYSVREQKSGDGLNYSPFWPKDRKVWRIDGLVLGGEDPKLQPVIIFSVANPMALLGQGKPGNAANETEFELGPPIRVAAVYYKIFTDRNRDGDVSLYPVVMAWQLDSVDEDLFGSLGTGAPGGIWGYAALPGMLLAVVIAAFYLVKRQVTQSKNRQATGPTYKPLRDLAEDDEKKPEQEPDPVDEHVDPELARAVEQFRQERGIE